MSKVLDRRDFTRMNGVLEKYGWADTGQSRYKHSTLPGTVILHAHSQGGAAWHHTGFESNRGVVTLLHYLERLHTVREMTAAASIGTSGSVSDPEFDDDVVKPVGGTRTGDDSDDAGGVPESIEDIHVKMQRHYFSNVGVHKRQNEVFANYARIHPRDGSVETVNVKFHGEVERWEHRHYGQISHGNDAESLGTFLNTSRSSVQNDQQIAGKR